jgi:double-stranded uracil-DNA glycosylase
MTVIGMRVIATRLQGLPAQADARTRLLVLGSFPGAASLAAGQYYGHPRNHFWPIMGELLAADARLPGTLSYENRSKWLMSCGVGLWDVYASCERAGSLDSAIRHAQVNDFAALGQRCPALQGLAHNGGESWRHAARVQAALGVPLPAWRLPSTSPANASWSLERKQAAWRDVMQQAGLAVRG